MLVFRMDNSHAWHGTTFDPNPPPLAPLAGSIKRPTKQISIAVLSATPHLLLVVISRPQWLVVKYLAINLSLHSPRDLFHLQLPALSKPAAAPTRVSCLMLPGMKISCYVGKVQEKTIYVIALLWKLLFMSPASMSSYTKLQDSKLKSWNHQNISFSNSNAGLLNAQ